MKNLIKARIAPLFRFTACAALIVCSIAALSLTSCDLDTLIGIISSSSSEDEPIPLEIGEEWAEGSLLGYWSREWYSFPVTQGTTYAVYQHDRFNGDGNNTTNKADIMVSAKYKGITGADDFIEDFGDYYWGKEPLLGSDYRHSPQIFTASQDGTVLLLVQGASWYYGTYYIKVVSFASNPSATDIKLQSVTADGNSTGTNTTQLTLTFDHPINNLNVNDIILSGVPGVVKGTPLSGTAPTYILPIKDFKSSGTVSVTVFREGYNISNQGPTSNQAVIYYNFPENGGTTTQGLYTGIIGFNDRVTPKAPTLLNTGNQSTFTGFIDDLEIRSGTGLYYAVDQAITMLKTASALNNLPSDLVNVSIVTFTDGLDNVSRALNPVHATRQAYQEAVQDMLTNEKIGANEVPITAYSIGIKGGDVTNEEAFEAGLRALATSDANVTTEPDMNAVTNRFKEIADSLYSESQSYTIKFKIPLGDPGEKVRLTFDNVALANVDSSTFFIEGTYTENGSNISLTNLSYEGMTMDIIQGATVSGNKVSAAFGEYTFVITSASGANMKNTVKLWKSPTSPDWEPESEYGTEADDVVTTVDRKSAVIILVLDCTTSLNANDDNGFTKMKTAAKGFITRLVESQTP